MKINLRHLPATRTAGEPAAHAPPHPPERADSPSTVGGTVDSQSILQGRQSIRIEHNGATYQLRTTRLGKLILTK